VSNGSFSGRRERHFLPLKNAGLLSVTHNSLFSGYKYSINGGQEVGASDIPFSYISRLGLFLELHFPTIKQLLAK
jgi:hypothetical protein